MPISIAMIYNRCRMRFFKCILILSTLLIELNFASGNTEYYCPPDDKAALCCTYIDELYNEQRNSECGEFDCWASQWNDFDRISLYESFYLLHRAVASGVCLDCKTKGRRYKDIFVMRYHWYLEYIALKSFADRCVFSQRPTKVDVHSFPPPKGYSMGNFNATKFEAIEITSSSFSVNDTDASREIMKRVGDLLQTSSPDFLWRFNKTDYRYGRALYFGCSKTVRQNVSGRTGIDENVTAKRVVFMSCVFAARKAFISTIGNLSTKSCKEIEPTSYQGKYKDEETKQSYEYCIIDGHHYFTLWEEHPCMFLYYGQYSYPHHDCNGTPVPETWKYTPHVDNDLKMVYIRAKDRNLTLRLRTTIPTSSSSPSRLTSTLTMESTLSTKVPDPVFIVSPPPIKPQTTIFIMLKLEMLTDKNEGKFCRILTLLYLILISSLLLIASLVFKFHIERINFNLTSTAGK